MDDRAWVVLVVCAGMGGGVRLRGAWCVMFVAVWNIGVSGGLPFLSSIVTVSFAHFMRNLDGVSISLHRY